MILRSLTLIAAFGLSLSASALNANRDKTCDQITPLKIMGQLSCDSGPMELYQALCEMGAQEGPINYSNGQVATSDLSSDSSPLFYSNGVIAAASSAKPGTPVYYSNQKLMTQKAQTAGVSISYADGSLMTTEAGVVGAVWYYPNGNLITKTAGVAGTTYYNPDGSVLLTNARAYSSAELLALVPLENMSAPAKCAHDVLQLQQNL